MQEIFILPASGSITVDVPAKFFYVKDISTPGASIRVQATAQTFDIDEHLVKGSKLSFLPEVVNTWKITNLSATQQTITVKLGLVYYEEDTIVGDINALTRAYVETDANNEFLVGCYSAQSAGVYSMSALLNPAGSGKIMELSSLQIQCSVNSSFGFMTQATLATYGAMLDTTALLGYGPRNKYIGQADAAAHVYGGTIGAVILQGSYIPTITGSTFVINSFLSENKPVKVPEGYAVFASAIGAVNTAVGMVLEFKEV